MAHSLTAMALLFLSGCASTSPSIIDPGIPTPEQAMSAINSRFLGRPIGEAVMLYGVPDGQTEIQGQKVFIWRRTNTITYSKSETVTTRGSISSPSPKSWSSSVPYVASSTYNRPEAIGYQCVLSIGTNANGIIDGAAIKGKMGACQVFVP